MPSPKPLPDEIKIIRGTDQKVRMNPDKPTYGDLLECPAHFKGEIKETWFSIVPMLMKAGVATEADAPALELLCEKKVQWRHAQDKVNEQGDVIEAPSGYPIVNPHFGITLKLGQEVAKLLGEFGMTPSSRQKISVPKQPKDNERFSRARARNRK